MALNKVEICGVNTSKLPVLTAEEKAELFRRIKSGDEQARELYIKGNLRLVLSVIRRFQNSSENADDLFQIGCIGLIKAIDNFDPAQNVRFSTYGVPMIIGEIRRFLRDNNALRVSRSLRDTAYRAMQSREALEKQGICPDAVESAGKASLLLDRLNKRRDEGLTTPKQIRCLEKYGFQHVGTWSFNAAKHMIDRIAACGWRGTPKGVDPKTYMPSAETTPIFDFGW